jgi:hypothetical protein
LFLRGWGCFSAGDRVVVAVDNIVGSIDGSCAGVINGDVFSIGGDEGLGAASLRGVVCIRALMVEVEVV